MIFYGTAKHIKESSQIFAQFFYQNIYYPNSRSYNRGTAHPFIWNPFTILKLENFLKSLYELFYSHQTKSVEFFILSGFT